MAANSSQKKALNVDEEIIASSARAVGPYYRIWLLFLLLIAVPLAVIVTDGMLRARHAHQPAATWIDALDLSSPALWPSGTPQRHPELSGPGRDLRFSPWLPLSPDLQPGSSNSEGRGERGSR
jgi:hypothetical protein